MDVSKIDRQELQKYGINAADLEPHLKAMSYGHKSPQMIPLNPELEPGIRVPTKGRVSLEEQADGSLKIIPHYWQEKPNLDAPFHGVLLNEQDKENLRQSLNAGRTIELEPAPGQKIPAFVSLDRLTNKLEALPVENISIPNKIKGADLSEDQQNRLGAGEKVLVEKMVSRTGRFFDGIFKSMLRTKSLISPMKDSTVTAIHKRTRKSAASRKKTYRKVNQKNKNNSSSQKTAWR